MSNLFNLDNHFFTILNKIVDCVILNFFWLICCLPFFTIGASTTAFYYTLNKSICNDCGYVSKEFFGAFKREFKQSTCIWIFFLLIYMLFLWDYKISGSLTSTFKGYAILQGLFIVMIFIITICSIYLFPYIARFSDITKTSLKNSMIIALTNLPRTLLLLILLALTLYLNYLTIVGWFFLPVIYMFFCVKILEKIFKKYIPEDAE